MFLSRPLLLIDNFTVVFCLLPSLDIVKMTIPDKSPAVLVDWVDLISNNHHLHSQGFKDKRMEQSKCILEVDKRLETFTAIWWHSCYFGF